MQESKQPTVNRPTLLSCYIRHILGLPQLPPLPFARKGGSDGK